jgi:tetratricopeptide (TPR) repeat protein
VVYLLAGSGLSQTYQVGPDSSAKPETQTGQAPSSGQQLGWGSNIENARLARAAELALQRGDYALALNYAERAARSAPNDPQLWLLLGYAARLGGKYGQSVEAYQRGLRLNPSLIDGLSGLAQTYSLMGRSAEAERLLKQVIAADPKRKNDLLVLGQLYIRSGDYTNAVEWLGKAERMEPSAQSELLLAVCYQHLKQMELASHYLELAKGRSPNNPDVDRSLAAFYRETGNYAKAIDALNAIRNPKPDVVAELAYTYGLDGKLEDSARLYTQAAGALPRDLGLQLSAAQAQVAIGSIDHANVFLQRASKLDSNHYRLHAIRGQIAQLQDRESEAAQEYIEAVANLPASPPEGSLYGIQLHMSIEALYRSLDEADLATRQLQIAQTEISALDERGADRAAFLRLRSLIKMTAGQFESALNDMTESLAMTPHDPNSLQLHGDLLMKMGRTGEAIAEFSKVLAIDPRNRFALTSLGYASRAAGNDRDAERYFNLLAQNYPASYVPFLALGDLYAARGEYSKAEASYSRGYAVAPHNSLIVAGGMSAAIESHDLPLAGTWLHRVSEKMAMVPQVLREKERYFSFMGDNQQSAKIGREAIKVMPHDRDVVVYLGYDLLRLGEYRELQALTAKYKDVFPKEPNIPLLAGYVSKHDGRLEQAVEEFTEALRRDPNIVTAYTNRGFVLNDLHQPGRAASDFEQALKREPQNAEAHMGLAFAELNLGHLQAAVRQTQLAEAVAGESGLIHAIRATAYGREGLLTKSAAEYRAALKFDSTDGSLYLGLGNVFFAQRRYREAVLELQTAQKFLPENASIYALRARANANLQDREQALRDVQLAEEYAEREPVPAENAALEQNAVSDIYVSTGEALSTLGDQEGAMERFSKALLAPKSNRVSVRLAIARLMAQQNHTADAQRQIALAQMEADAGDTVPLSGGQYIEAANILQQMHEYQLSETFLQHAKSAGAPDAALRVALANSYLGLGETRRAAAELAAVKQTGDSEADYQYLLAQAAVYQQEHRSTEAQSAFAQAASNAGADQTAEQSLLQAGASEGLRINPKLSVLFGFTVQPIFEDSTVYVLDSKLNSPSGPVPPSDTVQLPPPRSSVETDSINAFHLHLDNLPTNGGFFEISNARGIISVPATDSIVHRNTTNYALNFGLDPTVHLGSNVVTFNTGIQGTIRRDSLSPVQLNQNLFRVFTYVTTSSFFNAISADGFFVAEVGPFTEISMYERTLTGSIKFRVGAPWGKTSLVTGWGFNDQTFTSQPLGNSENYYTSSSIGLAHRFSTRLNTEAIIEDLRAWRVVPYSPIHSAISQALRPALAVDFSPTSRWNIQASASYESTRGFHVYDMLQSGFAVSYTRPLDRTLNDRTGEVHLKYPIRVSAGVREETFLNFTGGQNQQFRPYVSITLF